MRRAARAPRALGPLIALRHGERPRGVRRSGAYAPEPADAMAAKIGAHSRAECAAALRAAAGLYRRLRDLPAAGPVELRADAAREALAYLDPVG